MISSALLNALIEFRHERDWEQFHTVRNLSAAICVESAEFLDCFRWARDSEIDKISKQQRTAIEHEVADISILLSYLCHDLGISIEEVVSKKLDLNRVKYPVDKAKGNAVKYTNLKHD